MLISFSKSCRETRKRIKPFCVCCLLCILAGAIFATTPIKAKASMNAEIEKIIREQLSDEDYALLHRDDIYTKDLAKKNFDKYAIMRYYPVVFWPESTESLDVLLKNAKEQCDKYCEDYFLVFDEVPYRVKTFLRSDGNIVLYKDYIGEYRYKDMPPVYVKDLMGFSDSVKINDVSCKLQNIYLFDASMSQMGIALYVVTDKGVFVKLYDDFASEGKWYSEECFRKYAAAFWEYRTDPENNYRNGEGINYGISFSEFMENVYISTVASKDLDPRIIGQGKIIAAICVVVIVVLIAIGVRFVIISKRARPLQKKP